MPDPLDLEVGRAGVVRDAFEAMPVLMVAMEGPEHTMAAANAIYRAFSARSGFIGRPAREVFPDIAGQQLFPLLDRVFSTGEAVTAREWRIQMAPAGEDPTGDLYLDFTVAPWTAPDGSTRGLLVTQSDVTERVRARQAAERHAAEAERRYEGVRGVISALQEALLPTALPVLPEARVAARYLVAAQDQAAGGDWFDAVPLLDGRLALVVGDVVGHGVTASAAMGQARAVLNELLVTGTEPEAVVSRIDALAARTPALRAATLALVIMEPSSGALSYVTCGHPPPLVVGSDGASRFLRATGAGPLGTGSAPVVATDVLAPGEVVLLYSDGLIERPPRTLQEGMAELAGVAGDAVGNLALPAGAPAEAADRVCQLTIELLTRTGYSDDVTVLAAQRLATPVPALEEHLDGDRDGLRRARRAVAEWLDALELADSDRGAVELGIWEVLANAVEHAYPSDVAGPVQLSAALNRDGVMECRVIDQGSWRRQRSDDPHRGRGLLLAGALLDQLEVDHPDGEAAGTTVTMRHRLHRPALVASELAATASHDAHRPPFDADTDLTGLVPLVRARGPVDILTADELAAQLNVACRGGTLPLTVDLTAVSLLASAGVRVLYQVRDQLTAHDKDLMLLAPMDGSVHAVLDLVGLPHSTQATAPRHARPE